MLKHRIGLLALGVISASHAMASAQSDSNGFVEDSHASVLLRNAYINRDYKHGNDDKAEWGQAFIGNFNSGFTQGTVGVGVDAFALYAINLDPSRKRSGAGGIDFFKRDSSNEPADDLARVGGAIKFRVSNTVLKYGDMMPTLPVLNYDDGRLLPESFTGASITSKEIKGLEINAGHFTGETRKSATGRDSGGLKQIDVLGASYEFTENFKASVYASDVEDVLKKQYLGATYVMPLQNDQSLTWDFNGYHTKMDSSYEDRDNTIWSLAATWAFGPHALTLAHQRSSGDTGYNYSGYQSAGGVGDGGSTILLANSYWSDFNAEDERSWQLAYDLNFADFGVPGLTYRVAYVRGDNIRTDDGEGTEREIFNQLKYVVQSGAAKDLSVRLRSSFLRTSTNVRENGYNDDGNEVRVFVEYPISIF